MTYNVSTLLPVAFQEMSPRLGGRKKSNLKVDPKRMNWLFQLPNFDRAYNQKLIGGQSLKADQCTVQHWCWTKHIHELKVIT